MINRAILYSIQLILFIYSSERRRARALRAFRSLFCKAGAYARQIPAHSTYHWVRVLLFMHVSLLRARCGARTMYHPLQRRIDGHAHKHKVPASRVASALVAETAVRTFGVIDALGRVPSGSREGRVPSRFSVHHFFPIVGLLEMEAAGLT